ELKLMTDMNEYLIVEKGIRGCMTMILYDDMNALYSDAMTQYMPTEILKKVSPEQILDIQSIAPDTEIGYTLEVDLEASVHLHDFFADYPLASKKQIVSEE
ncbi:2677_t:CDS:2, partial [Funneliformis mosseae]